MHKRETYTGKPYICIFIYIFILCIIVIKVTAVLVQSSRHVKDSFRCERASNYQIPVVQLEYVDKCLEKREFINPLLWNISIVKQVERNICNGKLYFNSRNKLLYVEIISNSPSLSEYIIY